MQSIQLRILICLLVLSSINFSHQAIKGRFKLIAHRGGVVNDSIEENSRESIREAIKRGYWMVEIDLRATKDKELIIRHDRDLKKYFGVDSLVEQMDWKSISKLRSEGGGKVVSLEEALKLCSGKMEVMIDNKINGYDTVLFSKLIALLKKYNLYEHALMIGTDESTEYFTGKIKLSCTRNQLKENQLRSGYRPSDYYLFSDSISVADADWARENGILSVGVMNRWALKGADPEAIRIKAENLKATGITHFQIDSEFEAYFR